MFFSGCLSEVLNKLLILETSETQLSSALIPSLAAEFFDEATERKSSVRRTRAEHDSEAIHHQNKSFNGTESGTEISQRGSRETAKPIEMTG